MKLGTVTKSDNKNSSTSKRFDDDALSTNCKDKFTTFPIYDIVETIRRPESVCMITLL